MSLESKRVAVFITSCCLAHASIRCNTLHIIHSYVRAWAFAGHTFCYTMRYIHFLNEGKKEEKLTYVYERNTLIQYNIVKNVCTLRGPNLYARTKLPAHILRQPTLEIFKKKLI